MENKNYELQLPEGYRPVLVVDAVDRKTAIVLNVLALVLTLAGGLAAVFIFKPFSHFESSSIIGAPVSVVIMLAYLVLHELVHGAAYKLLTGRKLSFGFKGTVAYCGVPDIYVYRRAALISLLAPFVVFDIVFLTAAVLLYGSFNGFLAAMLLAVHIGGCAGDLYDTYLYLFKLRDSSTLMRDTGPKQTFYTKDGKLS